MTKAAPRRDKNPSNGGRVLISFLRKLRNDGLQTFNEPTSEPTSEILSNLSSIHTGATVAFPAVLITLFGNVFLNP
jgi:hypothetical protein